MTRSTHSERDKEVRKKVSAEIRASIKDSGYLTRAELPAGLPASDQASLLGEPLGIREVGNLIGCSAWTVRQKYIPVGLPHFRSGPNGKLLFYKNQVIRWLLRQQQEGGTAL